MNFPTVRTKADLDTLDENEIVAGYLGTKRGDPEPGANRGRAYWHGWRVRMMDLQVIKVDDDHRALVHEVSPRLISERGGRGMSEVNMVERVARAICAKDDALSSCKGDSRCTDRDMCPYPALARAAIEAMREPTADMSDAAFQIEADGHSQRTLIEAGWRAMIDEALGF